MLSLSIKKLAVTGALLIPLAACTSPYGGNERGAVVTEPRETNRQVADVRDNESACFNCGYVTAIEQVTAEGDSSGVGAAIGAVVGGVAGRQVGDGSGQDIATVAGVIGGAVAGNEIEKVRGTGLAYEVQVDMDSGTDRSVTVDELSGLDVGTYVEIDGPNLIVRR